MALHLLLLHVDQLDAHGHGVAHVEHLVEKVQKVKGKKGKDVCGDASSFVGVSVKRGRQR